MVIQREALPGIIRRFRYDWDRPLVPRGLDIVLIPRLLGNGALLSLRNRVRPTVVTDLIPPVGGQVDM
jgi:hypothetical protein